MKKAKSLMTVEFNGWVRKVRRHKNMTFIDLNNGILNKNVQFLMAPNIYTPKVNDAIKVTFERKENYNSIINVEKYYSADNSNHVIISSNFS